MRPLRNEVILEEIPKESKTESGIVLTDDYHTSRDKTILAKVVEVADAVKSLKINDKVLIQAGGYKVNIDGKELVFMEESQILAKYDES
tara:strand:+ start:812 stop:1078 length:267 start_codon:yes stop_codon:yes gene_type:complete